MVLGYMILGIFGISAIPSPEESLKMGVAGLLPSGRTTEIESVTCINKRYYDTYHRSRKYEIP